MMAKERCKSMQPPKLIQLSKQQYKKFHNIRKLSSESMGEYTLMSYNKKKFVVKQLPLGINFSTIRHQNQLLYKYTQDGHNLFLFPLIGEPLSDLWKQRNGQQIKQWFEKNGGIENSLLQLLKFCLNLYSEYGIQDIVHEFFRIKQSKVYYCYDTWMKGTHELLSQNCAQIQNYFLSQRQLNEIKKGNFSQNISITYKDYLFKLGLFIISLALPEVKIRNYQYGQFSLNKDNIQQKLRLFQIKVANRQLSELIDKFINGNIQNIDCLWKIIDSGKHKRFESPYLKSSAKVKFNSVHKKSKDKQNISILQSSFVTDNKSNTAHKRQGTKIFENSSVNNICPNYKKIRLRNKSNLNESTGNLCSQYIQQQKIGKRINLKDLLSKPPQINNCPKVLQYFGLNQYVSQSMYQNSIINSLEGISFKSDWRHKIYQNGSIFLGDFVNQKREGKGIYLFESEDFYFGDWKDNSIHGQGVYVFRSGQSYQGQLRKGLKHGYGRFHYKDKRIYEGKWEENKKVGFGTVLFPNGTKFLGFFNQSIETYGLFTWIIQNQFFQCQGSLQNFNWQTNSFVSKELSHEILRSKLKICRVQSQIPCLKEDENKYFGESFEGNPNGYGIKQSQRQIYEGSWKNGKEQGNGKLTVKNKFEIPGKWKDGILIQYTCK